MVILIFLTFVFLDVVVPGSVFEPVAAASNGNYLSLTTESVFNVNYEFPLTKMIFTSLLHTTYEYALRIAYKPAEKRIPKKPESGAGMVFRNLQY